ncbi:MAG: ParB/RepB/Spo0J family partition protein [Alphaproteobacteria bacterium]
MSDFNKSAASRQAIPQKPAPLGRGLSALFGDSDSSYQPQAAQPKAPEQGQKKLSVASLQPGKFQPRRHFDETALKELAGSIREHGVLQPLLVRSIGGERYEIIAGERRWRAAQMAGVHDVPVVVRELADMQAMEIALIENIQRQDLSPLEEAEGYRRLIEEFRHKQEELAKIVGKSRSHVANMMRLLGLPDEVKAMLNSGELTIGHARAVAVAADPAALARFIVAEKLNVRDAEALVRHPDAQNRTAKSAAKIPAARGADILALEKELTLALGLKIKLAANRDGSGSVTIAYKDLDQLDGVLEKLRG